MSKDSENNSPKLKRTKANNLPIVPINAINDSNDINHTTKYNHSISRRKVVKGRGYATATAAIPQLKHTESSKSKKVWKVLFDSGLDGDIAFIRKSERASIDMHTRLHPQRWKTSNGIFETNKVGNIKLTIPKFSPSKVMSCMPDIQFIEDDQPPPMYNLIIGLETLCKIHLGEMNRHTNR